MNERSSLGRNEGSITHPYILFVNTICTICLLILFVNTVLFTYVKNTGAILNVWHHYTHGQK